MFSGISVTYGFLILRYTTGRKTLREFVERIWNLLQTAVPPKIGSDLWLPIEDLAEVRTTSHESFPTNSSYLSYYGKPRKAPSKLVVSTFSSGTTLMTCQWGVHLATSDLSVVIRPRDNELDQSLHRHWAPHPNVGKQSANEELPSCFFPS